MPSNLHSPLAVPNHRNPLASCLLQYTVLSASPWVVLNERKSFCADTDTGISTKAASRNVFLMYSDKFFIPPFFMVQRYLFSANYPSFHRKKAQWLFCSRNDRSFQKSFSCPSTSVNRCSRLHQRPVPGSDIHCLYFWAMYPGCM